MKDSKIINGLALLGVLIVLLGVTTAATEALGAQPGTDLNSEVSASINQ